MKKSSSTQEHNRSENKRFILQIVLILSLGVIASIIVHHVMQTRIIQEREAAKPRYTVTFAYQDGTVIDAIPVKEGAGVFPPEFETEHVFRGWSAGFSHVQRDIEVHPSVYSITDEANLFYFNSVYVQEGNDFTIELRLGGNVNISSANLRLEYDPEVMKYQGIECSDNCTITKEKNGELLVQVTAEQPLREGCSLARITFHAKEKNVFSSEITLSCINGFIAVGSEELPATVTTINNKIFYLQEVSQ